MPKTDARGFAIYDEFEDTRDVKIRVKQSSASGMDKAWIFTDDRESVYREDKKIGEAALHLDREQALRLINALVSHLMYTSELSEANDD